MHVLYSESLCITVTKLTNKKKDLVLLQAIAGLSEEAEEDLIITQAETNSSFVTNKCAIEREIIKN